jgi:hypothetical protein
VGNLSNVDWDALAATADEYGPFLFALLFIMVLTIIAQRAYAAAHTDDQIVTFRRYFYASFAFGLLLVVVCTLFWIYDRELPHQYVYTVDIRDVPTAFDIEPSPGGEAEACTIPMPTPTRGYALQRFHAIFVEGQRLRPGSHLGFVVSPSGEVGPPAPNQFKPVSLKVNSLETDLDFDQLNSQFAANSPPQGPSK